MATIMGQWREISHKWKLLSESSHLSLSCRILSVVLLNTSYLVQGLKKKSVLGDLFISVTSLIYIFFILSIS